MPEWKDIGVPVISAILGSSLLGIFATNLVTEIGKPNLEFSNVFVNPDPFGNDKFISEIQAEIRNTGGGAATNVTIFMIVPGIIVHYDSPFHDQSVSISKPVLKSKEPIQPFSELRANTSMLSKGGTIMISLFIFVNNSYANLGPLFYPPFYLSVTSDQGGDRVYAEDKLSTAPTSVFSYLVKGHEGVDLPIDEKILWLSLGLSILCFVVAIGYRWKIFQKSWFREKFLLTVAAATLIILILEVLPITYLRNSETIIPTDLTSGIPLDSDLTTSKGGIVTQFEILIKSGIIIILIFIIRTLAGYLSAKKIITRYYRVSNEAAQRARRLKKHGGLTLFGWSIVFGFPLEAIISLLFSSAAYNITLYNLFILSLVFDIGRMSLIVFIVGRKLME